MTEERGQRPKMGLKAVFLSVLASFGGVQSREHHERDFQQGRARDFIIAGVVVTALFIGMIYAIVHLVMGLAGA